MSKLYGKRLSKKRLLKKCDYLQSELDTLWIRVNRVMEHLGIEEVTEPSVTHIKLKASHIKAKP